MRTRLLYELGYARGVARSLEKALLGKEFIWMSSTVHGTLLGEDVLLVSNTDVLWAFELTKSTREVLHVRRQLAPLNGDVVVTCAVLQPGSTPILEVHPPSGNTQLASRTFSIKPVPPGDYIDFPVRLGTGIRSQTLELSLTRDGKIFAYVEGTFEAELDPVR